MAKLDGNTLENFLINYIGASGIKGSGSLHSDIDFIKDNMIFELKTTINDKFRIKKEICRKIYDMASLRNSRGFLMVMYNKYSDIRKDEAFLFEILYDNSDDYNWKESKEYAKKHNSYSEKSITISIENNNVSNVMFIGNYMLHKMWQGRVYDFPKWFDIVKKGIDG